MGRKGKTQNHTAKELAGKQFAATVNRGGGTAGIQDRKGGAAGHAKYQCPVCKQAAPDPKSAQAHFESKHPKDTFDIEKWSNLHVAHGGTTQGVAVKGSAKK
mmetsp:Transcript_57002/g.122368  ORF Transcript_57002/g.122368 Transcript_57002/m.122368 type:complete len:102 (+) Transcript_57002:61-366(+)